MPDKHIHYMSTFCYSGELARLKEDALPSVFPFTSTTSKRRQLVTRIPSQPSICDYQGVQHEIIVESSNDETENLEIEFTLLGRFSIENIKTYPKAIIITQVFQTLIISNSFFTVFVQQLQT